MDKPTKSARDTKEDKVAALVKKIADAKSLTFANYHGLTANQIAALRAKIKAAGGELLVEKNTLVKLALGKNKINVENDQLVGPTAAIFAYEDEISPIKEIATLNKETGFPTFKFGLFYKNILDAQELESLAKLPSKDQLRAKVVGTLRSPIYGIVNVLGANLRNLVSVLAQASKKSAIT